MKKFLGSIFAFFILVLVVCYIIARQSNPVFLDEHGQAPSNTASVPAKPGY